MKKLNKLQINSEKLMKNEELVSIKGGYEGACCMCKEEDGTPIMAMWGTTSQKDCTYTCNMTWDPPYFGAWGQYYC